MTGLSTRRELLQNATAVAAAATLTIVPRHVHRRSWICSSER